MSNKNQNLSIWKLAKNTNEEEYWKLLKKIFEFYKKLSKKEEIEQNDFKKHEKEEIDKYNTPKEWLEINKEIKKINSFKENGKYNFLELIYLFLDNQDKNPITKKENNFEINFTSYKNYTKSNKIKISNLKIDDTFVFSLTTIKKESKLEIENNKKLNDFESETFFRKTKQGKTIIFFIKEGYTFFITKGTGLQNNKIFTKINKNYFMVFLWEWNIYM